MNDLKLPGATVHLGDCLDSLQAMAAAGAKVQMCVTSPPYFGLRDYGIPPTSWPPISYRTLGGVVDVPAMTCCLGLEETPEAFIGHMVEVFRAVRDVLADDGTCWVNIGDSYASKPNGPAGAGGHKGDAPHVAVRTANARRSSSVPAGLKHKDLIGIPWMLAFALRADGWYLRQEIIWHKPNPMPESVTDRCTKAHEDLFLLSKSPRYFFDHEAIKEDAKEWTGRAATLDRSGNAVADHVIPGQSAAQHRPRPSAPRGSFAGKTEAMAVTGQNAFRAVVPTRNRRSVWTIATRPYKGAHFAVFPPALVEPCVLAGTSERGHCPVCSARWVRQVEREFVPQQDVSAEKGVLGAGEQKPMDQSNTWQGFARGHTKTATAGWAPTCDCGADPVPDMVLDIFNGSGTSGQVSLEHGRHYTGLEINPEYLEITRGRLTGALAARAAAAAAQAIKDAEPQQLSLLG